MWMERDNTVEEPNQVKGISKEGDLQWQKELNVSMSSKATREATTSFGVGKEAPQVGHKRHYGGISREEIGADFRGKRKREEFPGEIGKLESYIQTVRNNKQQQIVPQ